MYLYNVTIIAENDVQDAVKRCIDAQLFGHPDSKHPLSLLEMLDSPHEGRTYCVQFRAENNDDILLFQQQHLSALQELLTRHYPGKVVFFDSMMRYLKD